MSHPSKSQQRFPFRTLVHIRKNIRRLPPIRSTIRPIEEERSIQSSLSSTSTNIKYETPRLDDTEFWVKLREHLASEISECENTHGSQNAPNKVVRIFVSSTLTDFFNEREILVKKVIKT